MASAPWAVALVCLLSSSTVAQESAQADGQCGQPEGVQLVPFNQVPETRVWDVNCSHELDELLARIPGEYLQLQDPVEEMPLIVKDARRKQGCFRERCFRSVHDAFATEEECAELLELITPEYGYTEESPPGQKYVTIARLHKRDSLLHNITHRMADMLSSQFGAQNPYPLHLNSRGEWTWDVAAADAPAQAAQIRDEILDGSYNGRQGHIDAARATGWHWTCLLYIGDHNVDHMSGGQTLLIDQVDHGSGAAKSGLLVEPQRGRLLSFTSGPENVHHAMPVVRGLRSLVQIWFGCRSHPGDW